MIRIYEKICISPKIILLMMVLVALYSIGAASFSDSPLTVEFTKVQGPSKPLRWAILLDLNRSTSAIQVFSKSVKKYASDISKGKNHSLFSEEPSILDTKGTSVTALFNLHELVSNSSTKPDVLFLAEDMEVSRPMIDYLRSTKAAVDIVTFLISPSRRRECDRTLKPLVVCIVPDPLINLQGLFEVASSSLAWQSSAVVSTNFEYAVNVEAVLSASLQEVSSIPTFVGEAFMSSVSTQSEDEAMLAKLIMYKPKGILCFVSENQLNRLHQTIRRANDEIFLLCNYEALNLLEEMNNSYQPGTKPYGALFVSTYTTVKEFIDRGYFQKGELKEYGAYTISHLFDGIRIMEEVGSLNNISALHAVSFIGFTGSVAFDGARYQRFRTNFSIISDGHGMSNPLVTWYSGNYYSKSVIENYNPAATSAFIPTSPLRSVVVCLAVPPTCAHSTMASALLYVLLLHNNERSDDDKATRFLPLVFNTGIDGIAGLSTMATARIGRTCTVLIGPGQSSVTRALTPVVNSYRIPQIDYASTDDVFTSDKNTFPFFSRTVPSDTFSYFAYSATCKYFAWGRVIILSTVGIIESSREKIMLNAMEGQNILVEKTFIIQNSSKFCIVEALKEIYEKHISRIILVMLPLIGNNAEMFYNLIDELPFMGNYIFFLSSELCLHGAVYPEQRNRLQSSICLSPYVPKDRLTELNRKAKANVNLFQDVTNILRDGNLIQQAETCPTETISSFAGFAVDAGYALIDIVERATRVNASIPTKKKLLSLIHETSIDRFTEKCTIDSEGERKFAVYEVNIQIPGSVLSICIWNTQDKQPFTKIYTSSFLWMTNSTSIPLDTFRDYSFILDNTMRASTGTILLCVLGILITFGLFFFFYQHYRVQMEIELFLLSNKVPVTEDELRRLKGIQEEI